jgi:hypothetical protein
MVRDAMVAFALIFEDIYKAFLPNHQRYITALKQIRRRDTGRGGQSNFFLTAICFVDLLAVSSRLVLDREETLTE